MGSAARTCAGISAAQSVTAALAGEDAKLSARHRELLILRVAWRTRSGYEWAQHSRMGADAGVTTAQIDAMTEGPAAPVWTPLERTLLTAVDEMIDDHVVGDTTWAALASSTARAPRQYPD